MSENLRNPRVQIASILCRALDEARLPWAITHGAEGLPDRVGRDFDILLPERFHSEAVALIKQVASQHGWSSCLVPLRWAGAPVFLWKLDGDTLHSFEMHFIERIDWAGCILADGTEAGTQSHRQNDLSLSICPAFAKRVLTQILAGCWERIEERPLDFKITPNEAPHLPAQMSRLFGRKAGLELLKLIECGDLPTIQRHAASYRMRLIIRAFLPGTGVRLSLRWLSGKFARTFGIAPWRPPNLVLIAPNEADFEGSKLLVDIIGHLGFAKSRILPAAQPTFLHARWRECWKNHIHRSLFRLLAIRLETEAIEPKKIAERIGSQCFDSGTFIAALSPKRQGDLTFALNRRGATTESRENLAFNLIASTIALRYLEFMQTMQKQTTTNTRNDQT